MSGAVGLAMWPLLAGAAVRVALMHSGAAAMLEAAGPNELVTSRSSLAAVREGAFLKAMGRSPFDGEMFRRSPIFVDIFGMTFEPESAEGQDMGAIMLLCAVDLAIALVLILTAHIIMHEYRGEEADADEYELVTNTQPIRSGAKANNLGRLDFVNGLPVVQANSGLGAQSLPKIALLAKENAPMTVAMVYLLNPCTLLGFLAGNINSVGILAVLLSMWRALRCDFLFGGFALGLAISLDLRYIIFIIPFVLQIQRSARTSVAGMLTSGAALFITTLTYAGLFLYNLHSPNLSSPLPELEQLPHVLVESVYKGLLRDMELSDLSPNIGLWWYFFIEVFEESREFFKLLFQSSIALLVAPLCITFGHRPQLLAHVLLIIVELATPYPDVGGIGLLMTLFVMHPLSIKRMQHILPFGVGMLSCLSMLPIMRHMWLTVGSGNANYYYFQTLISQFCATNLVVKFVKASLWRDYVLEDHYASLREKSSLDQ